jgi:hypothetical protein
MSTRGCLSRIRLLVGARQVIIIIDYARIASLAGAFDYCTIARNSSSSGEQTPREHIWFYIAGSGCKMRKNFC